MRGGRGAQGPAERDRRGREVTADAFAGQQGVDRGVEGPAHPAEVGESLEDPRRHRDRGAVRVIGEQLGELRRGEAGEPIRFAVAALTERHDRVELLVAVHRRGRRALPPGVQRRRVVDRRLPGLRGEHVTAAATRCDARGGRRPVVRRRSRRDARRARSRGGCRRHLQHEPAVSSTVNESRPPMRHSCVFIRAESDRSRSFPQCAAPTRVHNRNARHASTNAAASRVRSSARQPSSRSRMPARFEQRGGARRVADELAVGVGVGDEVAGRRVARPAAPPRRPTGRRPRRRRAPTGRRRSSGRRRRAAVGRG